MQTTNQSRANFFIIAGPLLLALFIDGMGLGLVFPILNALIMDPHGGFFLKPIPPYLHNILYGAITGIFMLCWFFGAAILGDLSDQIGRKKSLMICLLGAFFGYVLSTIAVIFHSISLLLLGRIIAGFTAGSQPIAQASIIDISTPEYKVRNIGLILSAISLGFILGPLFGGILSDNRIVPWFNFATPFYFAATVSLLNAGLLALLFKESFVRTGKISVKISQAIVIFKSAYKNIKIKNLAIIFFVFILGWSSFYCFIAMYLYKIYHFSPLRVSIFMAVMGVGFTVGNAFLVNYFTERFSLGRCASIFMLSSAILVLMMLLTPSVIVSWLLMAPIAACVAIAYSSIITIFSNQVSADSQGWVMGVTGSIMALVFGLVGILVGMLAALNVRLPLIIAIVCLGLAAVLMQLLQKSIGYSDKAVSEVITLH